MAGLAVIAIGDHFGKDEGETVGYYNHKRVKVGQRFTLTSEKDFSSKWMAKLGDKERKVVIEEEADKAADAKRKNPQPKSVL